MSTSSSPVRRAVPPDPEHAVRQTLAERGPVLLAVSGGLDSMALLAATTSAAPDRIAAVATFDHGTGAAARDAVALVTRTTRRLGVPCVVGRDSLGGAGEAAWREARWRFLRRAAEEVSAAAVATAHTRDDHLETVVMRILRGAGARGLAGLAAPSPDVVRPFRDVDRATLERYAARHALTWIEDPSNASPRYLRNRVRRELLPALRAARPDLPAALLALAESAAVWRRDVDAFVDAHVVATPGARGGLHVASAELLRYDAEALAVLWPAIAARAGVRLDRRGTARLVQFTIGIAAGAAVGAEMQLSGAIDVRAGRGEIVLGPRPATAARPVGEPAEVALVGDVDAGRWRFRRSPAAAESVWSASLPHDRAIVVRAWQAGDRMRVSGARPARRVKRFFADAHVPSRERSGWPVVLAGDDIVWIPGVSRSDAATDRPGRPGVHYICERIDG